jgi:hypothetical protein
MLMDADCRQRYRDYQELLGLDYAEIMLQPPSTPFEELLCDADSIYAHALGVQILPGR